MANFCEKGSSGRLRRLTKAYLTPYQPSHSEKLSKTSRIDNVYELAQKLLLNYQSVTSGLFPRFSKDQNIGCVKDSIYCALACWATSLAYKRLDDERGRQTELRQSAVKTMRGILFCWMQQADTLSLFKSNNSPEYALHARFDLQTGAILTSPTDKHYGHLQMDLVALYLLALVQMTSGGSKIIYTNHEVNFIQNLVFYIERTYRTPDFGMWERGTRYNNGTPEIHASSLGMVKAALEAINGFNVYGSSGGSSSVIYVDIDGHNRNRTTFETILPRESSSKNTDSSLLLTLGWPAFASHDSQIFEKTIKKCVRRLEGKYGLKRFLRDGFCTEIEDSTRSFYEEHETFKFQGIECQFPMFFAYIGLTAHLQGDTQLSEKYWKKLQDVLVPSDNGTMLVPLCYCVEENMINKERDQPNSTDMYPVSPNEFGHHLWSNSVYIIMLLIRDGLIHASDLDPCNRHLPASQRPKLFNRHSAFQGSMESDPVVQIALIAESSRLQMMLSTYGITSQTPHEVEPVQIWPSWRMVKVFECLGMDNKLGLSGRPPRPFGPLSTSKVFRVFGDTILCYPLLFEVKDFYITSDPAVLVDDIKRDIDFVARRWKLAGRPTMCIVLREENVVGEYFEHVLDLLVQLKNGHVNNTRVRMGRVHQLLNSSCIEHIDFATSEDVDFDIDIFEETDHSPEILSRLSLKEVVDVDSTQEAEVNELSDHELYEIIYKDDMERPRQLVYALRALWQRSNSELLVQGVTIKARMERLYRRACQLRLWYVVRYSAGILKKTINSLSPAITNMLVRGKQVTIGLNQGKEVCISHPIAPSELAELFFSCCPTDCPQASVMQQELIIACSDLISQSSSAFDGVLTVRLSWLMDAVQMLLHFISKESKSAKSFDDKFALSFKKIYSFYTEFKKGYIYDISPTAIKYLVFALMTKKNWDLLSPLQTRRLNGALNRMPVFFYDRVWTVLERCKHGIVIAKQYLPQQPTLSDMTEFELTFAYKIESMLSRIAHPEYRQLLIELLCIIATITERNPEISFNNSQLDCDKLITKASQIYAEDNGITDSPDLSSFCEMESLAHRPSTASYLTRTVIDFLLSGRHFTQKTSTVAEFDIKEDRNCGEDCRIQ
ncbi:unnamed protein product [Auanema sp. JU1783]|nr:unnamed protein product [Auanema sp. JU1783]